MFRRVLVANRGEIADRVVRALDALGIESVVAHSEVDRDAPWVRRATHAICIGPAPASESYLDATAILQAAEQTDCQALHPGYGFLAENSLFAARCEQQGLTFIGPTSRAIRRMGEKCSAKQALAGCGLLTIPGSDGALSDAAEALSLAQRIGYPVLLKAVAGGGGKGLRRCADPEQLRRGFAEARHEADKAFADGALYMERFVEGGRHVEFQVLADSAGHVVHLGERECSIQRQHQKLVEESPSPIIDRATREEVGARVTRAMMTLGYRSVGTLEFLRAPDGQLFFMEMNTRLQVEHAVTEMVSGIDLVVEQIRIAAHRPLAIGQEDVRLTGHAIEFRINAEDPDDGFRPDPGRIDAFEPPLGGGAGVQVRWDSALEPGYRIPPHYDSLIGKLIVHAPDRASALAGARVALLGLRIEGVATTIPFHRRLLENGEFCAGRYDVGFVERFATAASAG